MPSTEEQFFDDTAPTGISSMDKLLHRISNHVGQEIFKPVVIFNSTPRKGEARHELRRLAAERYFPQTTIYPQIQELLRELK